MVRILLKCLFVCISDTRRHVFYFEQRVEFYFLWHCKKIINKYSKYDGYTLMFEIW